MDFSPSTTMRFGKRYILFLIPVISVLAFIGLQKSVPEWQQKIYNSLNTAEIEAPILPDTMEYAPKGMSVVEQFKIFPSPQFKTGHELMPNFLWMDPIYFSGTGQEGVFQKEAVENSVKLQKELAGKWNYYLLVSSNTTQFNRYLQPGSFESEWVKLAQQHPEWKCAAISFWAQLRPEHLGEGVCNSRKAYAVRKDLHDSMYVMEDIHGRIHKRWNPANDVSTLMCDIKTQKFYFEQLHKTLKRPLDMINENAEVFHHFQDDQMLENSRVQKDMEKFKIKDPEEYQAKKRLEWECAYRDSVMKVKGNEKAFYSVYSIDGQNKYRHRYDIMRNLPVRIRGMNYATPDFYPRWPDNWKKWKGPWHGLDWIVKCRKTELENGDKLFSPFVAAGWDNDESKNIRPAQWLGMMKILGVMGAEFFYTGFFNLKKPYADPKGYAWQAVIPVYAQAVMSHAEDILLRGNLLNHPNFFIPSGKEEIVTVARKHSSNEHYLVATAIMVNSNEKNDRSKPVFIDIEIEGIPLHLESRRQGSVYRIENNNGEISVQQLDLWHEDSHPARWSRDLKLNIATWQVADAETESGKNRERVVILKANNRISKEFRMNQSENFKRCELQLHDANPGSVELIINGVHYPMQCTGGMAVMNKHIQLAEGNNSLEIVGKKGSLKIAELQLIHE